MGISESWKKMLQCWSIKVNREKSSTWLIQSSYLLINVFL